MSTKRKAGILLSESALRRRYPESNIATKITLQTEEVLKLPSRNLALNFMLGGGIKYGSIIEVSGEESTGKTLLAIDLGIVAQSMGGVVLWDDAECTFDRSWAEKHGLDMSKVELLPNENGFETMSDWVADMCVYYRSKLTNNEPILLVIDSVAVLEGEDAMEVAEMDAKAEMGRRSFNMGKFLRKRMKIFAKYGICVILINQLRKKVGASQFEDDNTTPLEQAIKFYASQRIRLFKGKRIRKGGKDKGPWVGNIVYIRTHKNKTAAPQDNIQARVFFRKDGSNFGYDKYWGLIEILEAKKVVERDRGKFSFNGNIIAKGEDNFRQILVDNSELRAELINELKINTPSKLRKKLESLNKNYYPVKLKVKSESDEE